MVPVTDSPAPISTALDCELPSGDFEQEARTAARTIMMDSVLFISALLY
jgi:hypothetical protein